MNIKILLLCGIAFTTVSCAETNEESENTETEVVQKEVGQVTIHFKNGNDELQKVFNSTVKEEFEKFTTIISDKTAPKYKCGYTGNIVYSYADGSIRDCDFNIDESCNHIVYMENGDLVSKEITPEGREALLSLMEKGGIIATAGVEPPMVPDAPEKDLEKMTAPMMESLKKNYHPDIYEGNGPKETIINHFKFKPHADAFDYMFVQVSLKRGEVTLDDFVLYYPDEKGVLNAENYYITTADEHPCTVCDMQEISTTNGEDPIGTFTDRATGKEFKLSLGYNLEEIYFYWFK